jgi:hypothetical protein
MDIFLKLFYCFGRIILLSIELNITYIVVYIYQIYQILKVYYIPSDMLLFWPYWSLQY